MCSTSLKRVAHSFAGRSLCSHSGELCIALQDIVESFKKTMPLITDLRNPAMRERHWAQLMDHIGAKFDPAGEAFTLESVINLHLDQHVDFIAELSGNASKELGIETAIQVTGCINRYAALCTFKAEVPACHMLPCHATTPLHQFYTVAPARHASQHLSHACRTLPPPGQLLDLTWLLTSRHSSYAALRR